MIAVNSLLKIKEGSVHLSVVRVLWVDELNDEGWVINVIEDKGVPYLMSLSALKTNIANEAIELMKEDPWAPIVGDETLTTKQRELRDKGWSAIEGLVKPELEPQIFQKDFRGELIKKAAEKSELEIKTIYKYLRKFWQRGKVQNALIPDFFNCGGKGKNKSDGAKKRGRPRKFGNDPEIGEGININEEIRRIFHTALKRFYLNEKETPLPVVYDLMVGEYFVDKLIYENGQAKTVLVPDSEKPSYGQFKYWASQIISPETAQKARKGGIAYDRENRAHLGSSTGEVYGPGERCQIDATVADIYLVSRYNRKWVIGRPVIYVIIDVFSRLIVGIYVGLEGPSWLGAMMAICNAARDKFSFCQEYKVPMDAAKWPCAGLPQILLSDGGEVKSRKADPIVRNLGVHLEAAKAYAPDWKGIIERHFRTIQEKVKPFVPGYVEKDALKRVGNAYRLDAKLDIFKFTQIIIQCVLQHNSSYLPTYPRDEQMIADDVSPIPLHLWDWGIRNRSGSLKYFPEEIVKLNLMPVGMANITSRGILFEKMRYSCERAIREQWFDRASIKGNQKIEISYDPRTTNYVYLKSSDGRSYETCYLLDPDNRYSNKDIYEITYLHQYEEYMKQRNRGAKQQENVNLYGYIKQKVQEAENQANLVSAIPESKKNVLNIRENREQEKAELRKEQVFDLSPVANNTKETTGTMFSPERARDIQERASPDFLNLLKQKRKEIKDGE
ncbi:MAG: transposase family protein [Blastocatellia bacterium]|nr:transposase family protein [Blastocatellia bacterium]